MIVQGDVYLLKVNELPDRVHVSQKGPGPIVLARGEATGHAHAIRDVTGATLYEKGGVMYLKVAGKPVSLVHEEHKSVTISEGIWLVGIVREYDPFIEKARPVED